MKIGIVCYPTLGGSGILATELGRQLALRGHEVHFITYEVPFRLQMGESRLFFHKVEVRQYDLFKYPDYSLPLAVQMASVARHYCLDLLHVHYAIPHATSAYLAKQLLGESQIAVLTTLHGTDITLVGQDPAYFQIVKFSIEQSNGVTAVSHSLKHQTCTHFAINKPIEVIHNFFIPNQKLLETKPLRHLFVSGKQKLLLHSSNYRPVKRVEDVIKIFKHVHQQVPCRLLLLGTGEGIGRVRLLAQEEGVGDDVIFLGKSRHIDPYVASADLFLLPSSQESFGLAALEATAYGVPVIASDVGGIPELIQDGKTGYLAPVGAIEKMAQNALTLLANEDLYRSFSLAARQRAATCFSADNIIPLYENLYRRLILH